MMKRRLRSQPHYTADASAPRLLWPVVFVTLACLMMLGLQGWIEWVARATQLQQTGASLVNLASSLTQQAEDTIDIADTAVTGAVKQLEINGTSPEALGRLDAILAAQKVGFSRLRDITVIDKNGDRFATSLSVRPDANLSDRIYFRRHRDDSDLGLYLSPPIKSSFSGKWVITASRRFKSADGNFAGVVFAVINLSDFDDHYSTYDLGPNSAISLSTTEATLLARYPPRSDFIGRVLPNGRVFQELSQHSFGSYVNVALIDGTRRITGYRRGGRYPLVVVAAMSEDYVLQTWRANATRDMAITLVLTGAIGLLGLHLVRQVRRSRAAELHGRESEERLRLLLQSNVTEALYLLDPDGNVETWNASAERIKGYTPAEIIGRNFGVFFTPEDLAAGEPARALASARDSNHLTTVGWRVRKDGTRFLARVAIDAIRRDDGTLRGFVKVTLDITKQRAEEAERDRLSHDLAQERDRAEQANQAKSRFLAGMTHELRTPLHGILGYAEMLILEGGLTPMQSERLEVMIASGQHLLEMISAVLDMSQIEAGRMDLHLVEIELPSLIRICLDVVRPAAESKGLVLLGAPTAPLHLFADATRLRQVLINLLGNAVKFTPSGIVEVRLRQTEPGGYMRLEVADTGPGIRGQHRDKLFQAFERLNADAVSGIEGAGLGLSLAARLVLLMNGRIGYADNPGGGSVFWLELPACDAAPAADVKSVVPSHSVRNTRLRVLVADDEPLNRSIAKGFLSIAGHEVVCVDNGAAAVEAATIGDFDVILMDVRMPGMNGLEATRRIRALPGQRGKVRVVAVTAQAFEEQIEMCRQAGMDSHVAKPFTQTALLAALEDSGIAPRRSASAVLPPIVAKVNREPEFPVFDREMFEDITDALPTGEANLHMQTLIARCEALLVRLGNPRTPASELADEAHKLAGGAGTLGFLAVAAAARQFEVAADENAPEMALFGEDLAIALNASMTVLRQELGATATIVT